MRRLLDGLYDGTAALAALSMVGLLVAVLLSVGSRQLGFHIPGIDGYAGYLLAATGFLSLAHTLKRGEHIRVTLLLQGLHGRARRALELWCLFAGAALAGLFAFYACRLVWQSHTFNDLSTGSDATPLWLPQLAMAAGAVVMTIALLDELWLALRGAGRPAAAPDEPLRNE